MFDVAPGVVGGGVFSSDVLFVDVAPGGRVGKILMFSLPMELLGACCFRAPWRLLEEEEDPWRLLEEEGKGSR